MYPPKVLFYKLLDNGTVRAIFNLEGALANIARNNGVTIEAVVHSPASGRSLCRKGIKTKVWKQSVIRPFYDPNKCIDLMHHKFFIIDDEILLTGSLNWTREGITGNHENVLITTNKRAVENFKKEFNKMWFLSELQVEQDRSQFGKKIMQLVSKGGPKSEE